MDKTKLLAMAQALSTAADSLAASATALEAAAAAVATQATAVKTSATKIASDSKAIVTEIQVPDPVPTPVPNPTPTPTPTLTFALTVAKTATVGDSVSASVVVSNASTALPTMIIAGRNAGATHSGGPYNDFTPSFTNVKNGTYTATHPVTAAGQFEVYVTYQDAQGVWHDQSSQFVTVAATPVTPDPTPTPTPTPVPNPTPGNFTYPLSNRIGSQVWEADWMGGIIVNNAINPQLVTDYKAMGFTITRFMDMGPFGATNNSSATSWSQRVLPTGTQGKPGVALELLIDFCNQTQTDMWLCHPLNLDDDAITQCATMVKAKLNAGLRVITEFSNEVWNGGFQQANQAIQKGVAGGLPGTNQWYQGIAWEMKRALEMYQLYQNVFGADQMGSKVIRVFSQSGNLDLTTQALKNVYQSAKWNPKSQKIDMLAVAPYIGNGTNGAAETLARWNTEADKNVTEYIKAALSQAKAYGIPMVGEYEGGQSHLQNAQVFAAASPLAYDCYTSMLQKFMPLYTGPVMLYTSHGTWQSGGAWGLLNKVGDSIDASPKAKAVRDWIKAHQS